MTATIAPGALPPIGVGDRVVLLTPDNPRLDGHEAIVRTIEDWGCHVRTSAAATGCFRALWSEMAPAEAVSVRIPCWNDQDEGEWPQPQTVEAYSARAAVEEGYVGAICDHCGSARVVRAGSCLLCRDCGTSGGC